MIKYIHYGATLLALIFSIAALAKQNDTLAAYAAVRDIQSTVGDLAKQKDTLVQNFEQGKSSIEDMSNRLLGTTEVYQTDLHTIHQELTNLDGRVKKLQAEVRQLKQKTSR